MTERLMKRALTAVAIMAAAMLTLLAVGGLFAISEGPNAGSLPVLLTSIAPAEANPRPGNVTAFSTSFADPFPPARAPEHDPAQEPEQEPEPGPASMTAAALPAGASIEGDRTTGAPETSLPPRPPSADFVPDKLTPGGERTSEGTSTIRVTTAPVASAAGTTTTSAKPSTASTRPVTTTTSRAKETYTSTGSESRDDEHDHEVIRPKIRETDSKSRETHDDGKD